MARALEELTDREIENFVKSYEREAKTEGGIYSLAELRVEKLRRLPSARPPGEVTRFVIKNASKSPSGTITYNELWNFLSPGVPWKGNHSIKIVGSTLGAAIAYCIKNKLPLVSTLVVRTGSRTLSDRAIEAIYNDAKAYGLNVGLDAKEFVIREAQKARDLRDEKLEHL
jgi:hypothetical protein